MSKVKDVDEVNYESNAEPNVRVNFIAGCVAEINFRDKVSPSEKPTLFYTHDEEYQFSAVSTVYNCICIHTYIQYAH